MKIIKSLVFLLLLLCTNKLIGQKVFTYIVNDFAEINPAGLSITDTYQLNIKGFNSPDLNYSFNGGYLKLIVPVKKINSGIGFHLQFYKQNNFSDAKYGLSYAYKHKFSENSYLAMGAKGSLFTFQDKYYKYIINGVRYGETEFESYKFNLDAGIWFQSNNLGIGLSLNHLNSPAHISSNISGVIYDSVIENYTGYDPEISPLMNYIDVSDTQYSNPYAYELEFNIMLNHKLYLIDIFTMTNSIVMYDIININDLTEIKINNILELNNTFVFGSAWEILHNNKTQINFYNIIGINLSNKYKIYLSHLINEYEFEDSFTNTSRKEQPKVECSFIINF